MQFIETFESTVCPVTKDERGNILYQRVRQKGSVIAVEDAMALDMVKYKKGTLHPGPTHDIWELPPGEEEPERLARPTPKAPPERPGDLGDKLARAEKAVAPAQRAGAI